MREDGAGLRGNIYRVECFKGKILWGFMWDGGYYRANFYKENIYLISIYKGNIYRGIIYCVT
jgi:hypothetical protein